MAAKDFLPLDEAYCLLDQALVSWPKTGTETVPTRTAKGRRLAANQYSRLDIPPFDKAAMDGYALLAGDDRQEYRLLGTTAAGTDKVLTLEPGSAVKVMTGAAVPPECGRVIERELVKENGAVIHITGRGASCNICRRGEDIKHGQLVMPRGRRLGAVELANLISCGLEMVEVFKPVSLAVVSTGNELASGLAELKSGQIINSNGPLLTALAEEHGLIVQDEITVGDDLSATEQVLREVLDKADIAVMSGGVSEGEFDYVPRAIKQLGLQLHFNRLAVKPGRPTTFATAPGRILFGLPGNPVAVFLMFHLLVLRAVGHLYGIKLEPRTFRRPLAQRISGATGQRRTYAPARLSSGGTLALVEYHGSAHQAALLAADGFAVLPAAATSLEAGDRIGFMPLLMEWDNA